MLAISGLLSSALVRANVSTSSSMLSKMSSSGMGMSLKRRMSGRAIWTVARWKGKIFSMYQRAMSGKLNNWSVAPVGAASITITS